MLGEGKEKDLNSLPIDCNVTGEGQEADYSQRQSPTACYFSHTFRRYLG